MIAFVAMQLMGFLQVVLLLAFILNIAKIKWEAKHLLFALAVIQIPYSIIVFIFSITLLTVYIWILFVILAFRLSFKLSWRKSIFIGVFINFISLAIEYTNFLIIVLLTEDMQEIWFDSLYIHRVASIIFYTLLYIFSKRIRRSEYSPLDHFASTHWILYFLIFAAFADYNLANLYNEFAVYNVPEVIVIVMFLLFFLYNILYLSSAAKAFNLKRELKTQQIYADSLRGFRHDFANIINSMHGMVDDGNIPKLKAYMEEITVKILASHTIEISDNVKKIPVLHGILREKIYRAEIKKIKLHIAIMGENIDLRYCSDLDYSRMVGILLDNALEAADESELRTVEFIVRNKHGRLESIIINSCDSEVDIDRIFERGYSTKRNPSGEGLYQIRLFQEKYQKLGYDIEIKPDLSDGFFSQILKI